jgi:crotonobetainyl-CoA:carnitine CoA-transferase CaiB-like acyl-CoA transferase
VLGVPELTTDPRFEKRDTRKANRRLLTPLLEARLKTRPTAHWVEQLNARGVPSGEILSLENALNAHQVAHRQSLGTVVEPEIGPLRLFSLTAKFEKTAGGLETPPPRLGAHTEAVLEALGYSAEDVAGLRARQVI